MLSAVLLSFLELCSTSAEVGGQWVVLMMHERSHTAFVLN